jgi:hypothetical protein
MTRPTIVSILLMMMSGQCFSAPSAGHWSTGMTNGKSAVYAATSNDDGFVFGKYCFFSSKTCSWHVALNMSCNTDATYPVLASTEKGASAFSLICVGKMDDTHYEYVFTDWKGLEQLVSHGDRLGIVTSLQSDQFRVYRFLLDGLPQTTSEVETDFFSAVTPKNSSTSNILSTASETL